MKYDNIGIWHAQYFNYGRVLDIKRTTKNTYIFIGVDQAIS